MFRHVRVRVFLQLCVLNLYTHMYTAFTWSDIIVIVTYQVCMHDHALKFNELYARVCGLCMLHVLLLVNVARSMSHNQLEFNRAIMPNILETRFARKFIRASRK